MRERRRRGVMATTRRPRWAPAALATFVAYAGGFTVLSITAATGNPEVAGPTEAAVAPADQAAPAGATEGDGGPAAAGPDTAGVAGTPAAETPATGAAGTETPAADAPTTDTAGATGDAVTTGLGGTGAAEGRFFPPVWIPIFLAGALLPLSLLVLFPRRLPFQPLVVALIATAGIAITLSAGLSLAQTAALTAGDAAGWATIAAAFAAIVLGSIFLVRLLPAGRPSRTAGVVQAVLAAVLLVWLVPPW